MKELARETIKNAALVAGLDPAKVYELVESDNLTIKRPYMTIQFLPEVYARTGRKLAIERTETEAIPARGTPNPYGGSAKAPCGKAAYGFAVRKRELYTVELTVAANILTEDEKWLSDFAYDFVATLPRGMNDSRGNWVKIRAQKAEFSKPADKRVGYKVIEVFRKRDQLFMLTFTGRLTTLEREELLPEIRINPYWKGYYDGKEHNKKD